MAAQIVADHLRCEYLTNPLGIDTEQPQLSWQVWASQPEQRGLRQKAYQILVASNASLLATDTADVWDSGKITSSENIHISYTGQPLLTGRRYWWKVHLWDNNDEASPYSQPAFWEMGLLHENDWQARWIGSIHREMPADLADEDRQVMERFGGLVSSPYLRKSATLTQEVLSARLYISARGIYEAHINGQRVGNAYFAPGWTDYTKRIQYQTYDVSELLQRGENAFGLILGTGWYSGHIGFDQKPGHGYHHYGPEQCALFQLHIEYTDGSNATVLSDESWRYTTGPIIYSDFLAGELYDAQRELQGWSTAGYVDSMWQAVKVEEWDTVPLVAELSQPVLVTEELQPLAINEITPGTYIFDMGQNMVGWVRLRVQGQAGTRIKLRHIEMLNPDGTAYITNLRAARQVDTYILKGDGEEIFEPHFTFHGFRYVEVTGYPGIPDLQTLAGCVAYSAAPVTGTFESSHPLVNQLQHNIQWGQRGNFLSVPTDCPQRDERLGWMGDAQIFIRTATYNMDVAPFFKKWMDDVVDAQSEEGGFSDVAPRLVDPADGAPAWGDAGVIVPWTLYQMYGDIRFIERYYEPMKRWLAYIQEANPDLLWTKRVNNNFGDWLSIEADTPKEVLATAYFAYDALLVSKMARIINRLDDAEKYRSLYRDIAAAFRRAYVSDDGRIKGDTQTGYVLALHMQLLPENLRLLAAQHLVTNIREHNGHLSTGFVGVGYLCPVLSEAGYNDVAYRLLLNETFPSWGYSIKQGATTIWERWDGWTEDKGFQDPGMNSFNHYSLGSVGQWLFQYVAGIDVNAERPGFRHILIHPHPGPGLEFARAEFQSMYGPIRSSWQREGNGLTVQVTIPANTTATIVLPIPADKQTLYEGDVPAVKAPGVTFQREEQGNRLFKVGSGNYTFRIT